MKKILFVIVTGIFLAINSFGQESYIKNRLNFKTGYSRLKQTDTQGAEQLQLEITGLKQTMGY